MYGTQTSGTNVKVENQFENDVKCMVLKPETSYDGVKDVENDVKCMVLKLSTSPKSVSNGLRMM